MGEVSDKSSVAGISRQVDDIIAVLDEVFGDEQLLSGEASKWIRLVRDSVSAGGPLVREALTRRLGSTALASDHPVALGFFLFDLLGDPCFLDRVGAAVTDTCTPAAFYEIYWNIGRRCFVGVHADAVDTVPLRRQFERLSAAVRAVVGRRDSLARRPVTAMRRIAILSPQILGMQHSPTREAVSIALHLKQYHGCEVFVFNTNGMSYTNRLGILDPFIASFRADFSGIQTLQNVNYLGFAGETITLVSLPAGPMTTKKVIYCMDVLAELDVDGVIAHGENLLYQDALFDKRPSLFATTGGVVPFARSDAYWVPGSLLTPEKEAWAERLGHSDFMKEQMLVTPAGEAAAPLARSDFSISEDAVVYLVVSTRLPGELTDGFRDLCARLLRANPRAVILFAGSSRFDAAAAFAGTGLDPGRLVNIGFSDDLPAVCAMADVYLNPFRTGGGTSAQTAIMNGLPVVTLDMGHISAVVPSSHRQPGAAAYLTYAARLGRDAGFLDAERAIFREHGARNLQVRPQIARMFEKLESIAAQRYAS